MSLLSSRPEESGVILWSCEISGVSYGKLDETNGSAVLLMMSIGVLSVAF